MNPTIVEEFVRSFHNRWNCHFFIVITLRLGVDFILGSGLHLFSGLTRASEAWDDPDVQLLFC